MGALQRSAQIVRNSQTNHSLDTWRILFLATLDDVMYCWVFIALRGSLGTVTDLFFLLLLLYSAAWGTDALVAVAHGALK